MKEVSIKDLGEIVTGHTPPKKDPNNYGGPYPFIKPTDMDVDRRHVVNWEESYSEKAFEKYKKAYIPPGATGVVTIGTVGEKIFQSHIHCFTNQSVNVVKPSEKYDNDYVYYLLKLNLNKVLSANPGTASGRHHVSKSNFGSIKIRVIPEVNKQEKIGQILGRYDDLIENNLKRINLLEQAAQNIYKEWFVNMRFPGHESAEFDSETGLPEGWKEKNINEVFNIKYGKNLPTSKISTNDKFHVYGASGIMGFYKEHNAEFKIALITSRGNGSGEVHRTYQDKAFVTNNSFMVWPVEDYRFYPFYYVTEFLKMLNLKNYCSGSAQPQLTNASMKNIKGVFPNSKLVNFFKDKVSPMMEQADLLRIQNDRLKEARDILLPRLMNQTIEV